MCLQKPPHPNELRPVQLFSTRKLASNLQMFARTNKQRDGRTDEAEPIATRDEETFVGCLKSRNRNYINYKNI